MDKFLRAALLATGLLAAGAAGPALGADYPAEPVRLIIGFGPGTATDVAARALAQRMGELLGQPMIVESRPGSGSSIAADYVVRAPKDGYTLFMGTVANTINAAISRPPFNFATDLAPIGLVAQTPNILVVHPSLGVSTVKELIALAKTKPGQIFFGSSGVGTSPHVSGELFNMMAGTKLVHLPYQGSAQAVTDLVDGRIAVMFAPVSTVLPYVASGAVKALASTTLKRPTIAPNLPTMDQAGLPGFDTSIWFGLNAPAGTPREVIDKLSRALNQALATPDVIKTLRAQGIEPLGGQPEDYARVTALEIEKWSAVAKAAGMSK